jgi:hypothetical protein
LIGDDENPDKQEPPRTNPDGDGSVDELR